MELTVRKINDVNIYVKSCSGKYKEYQENRDFKFLESYSPKITFDKELNKYKFDIHLEASSDGSDYEYDVESYFDSIQDIIKFLGLDIKEEK